MNISEAMNDLWKTASDEGFTDRLTDIGDDEDIQVFAINFLISNITDIFGDIEEDESPDGTIDFGNPWNI